MNQPSPISRRHFISSIAKTGAVVGAAGILASSPRGVPAGAEIALPRIAAFSKVYQELKLDFEQSAAVTADAGLDGIDCAVRAGGEIVPEKAADEMPRYAEALAKRNVRMLLLTTGITGVDSSHARAILETGKKLGIRYYRLGYWTHQTSPAAEAKQYGEIHASLKELAALNRELGLCGMLQNHSNPGNKPGGQVGGDLNELYDIVKDFDPDQIGVAFDLGHALVTHGDDWHKHFERLKDHIRVFYVKDVRRPAQWVPFGEGEFGRTDFFSLVKKMNYRAPLSLHIEYAWAPKGNKTRTGLVETLKTNRRVLGQWWQTG